MKYLRLSRLAPIAAALMIAALLIPSSGAHAASKIAAIVNGAVITSLDVSQRQKLARLMSGGKTRLGKSAALNALIDDKIKLREARARRLEATQKEVDAAANNMASNVRMSKKRMFSILRQTGINKETLLEWLKVELSWQSLIRARFNAEVRVNQAEIVKALSKDKSSKKDVQSAIRYDLTQITFVLRKNAPKREQRQRLAEAKRYRGIFKSCTTDIKSARNIKDVAVSRVGRRTSTDMPPHIAKALRDTAINRLTPPEKGPMGYQMMAVCKKEDLGKDVAMRNMAESKIKNARGRDLGRKYLQELRGRAIIERR